MLGNQPPDIPLSRRNLGEKGILKSRLNAPLSIIFESFFQCASNISLNIIPRNILSYLPKHNLLVTTFGIVAIVAFVLAIADAKVFAMAADCFQARAHFLESGLLPSPSDAPPREGAKQLEVYHQVATRDLVLPTHIYVVLEAIVEVEEP